MKHFVLLLVSTQCYMTQTKERAREAVLPEKREESLPDTNTIIRDLIKDTESLYIKAKEFFDEVQNGTTKAIVRGSVIAECIHIPTKIFKVPRRTTAESLIDILHYKEIANDGQKELIYWHANSLFRTNHIQRAYGYWRACD